MAQEKSSSPAEQPTAARWKHPGGKLWELGAEHLTDDELLAVLIGSGTQGRSALEIAKDILDEYCSIYGIFGKDAEALLKIRGFKKVKLIRLMACYELARRLIEHDQNWGDFKPLERKQSPPKKPSELF
ncbi:MAG: hypothetical protein FJ279_14630 [Planctomycetes bacterium]|nr:hypothetical protein [Planctomycetota bacterium]